MNLSYQIFTYFRPLLSVFMLAFLLALTHTTSNGQTWERNYGELNDTEYAWGNDIAETTDGNFLVLGGKSIGDDPAYAHLWKINQSGDTLWTKSLPGILRPLFLHITKNGFVLVTEFGELIYLDSNGGIVSRTTIAITGIRIQQCIVSSGGFAFLGFVPQKPFNVLFRTTASGDTLWTRRYPNPNGNPSFYKIHETSKGNLMVSGTGFRLGVGTTLCMWAVDKDGSIISQKDYLVPNASRESDFAEAPDGGYMIVCQGYPSTVMKVNSAGDSLWTKKFVNSATTNPGTIRRLPDGYIVQRTAFNPVESAYYIILNKIDFSGAVLWERTILHRDLDRIVRKFEVTSDGNFLMTGYYGNVIQNISSFYLLKTNSLGIFDRSIGWEQTNPESFDHRVVIPASVTSNIEGKVLEWGDYIGAYFKDENGIWKLNASVRWEGVADTLNLTRNSGGPVKDGFDLGEKIVFRIRKPYENRAYDVNATYDLKGSYVGEVFTSNSISNIRRFRTPIVCQQLQLHNGWNLVSIYVKPRQPDMNIIFRLQTDVIVKDASGKIVFAPQYGILTGNWNILEGYMIYSGTNQVVQICGDEIDPWQTKVPLIKKPYPVFLPYFASYERTNYHMFLSLGTSFLFVQSLEYRDGETSPSIYNFIPQHFPEWIELSHLKPGLAYRVMLTDDVPAFAYPSGLDRKLGGRNAASPAASPLQHFAFTPSIVSRNAVLVLTDSAMQDILEPGDEIAVLGDMQQIVGAKVYTGFNVAISLFETPRLNTNNSYSLVVYKKNTNTVHSCDVSHSRGDGKFYPNTLSIIDGITLGEPLAEDQIIEIFPNPVQTELTIKFNQYVEGVVEFSLLDSTGKKRKSLLNEHFDKGVHYKQFNITDLPDGLYVYQLINDDKVQTGKIIVNKK